MLHKSISKSLNYLLNHFCCAFMCSLWVFNGFDSFPPSQKKRCIATAPILVCCWASHHYSFNCWLWIKMLYFVPCVLNSESTCLEPEKFWWKYLYFYQLQRSQKYKREQTKRDWPKYRVEKYIFERKATILLEKFLFCVFLLLLQSIPTF